MYRTDPGTAGAGASPPRLSWTPAPSSIERSASCPAQLVVEHRVGRIIVKEAVTEAEHRAIGELRYRIYVEDLNVLRRPALPSDQRRAHCLWDEFDREPGTRQVVALLGRRAVGSMRLVDDSHGGLPLELHGFSFDQVRSHDTHVRELGRLAIAPFFRRSTVLIDLYRLTVHLCRHHDDVHELLLCCQPHLESSYRKLNAHSLGRFTGSETGPSGAGAALLAMRIDLRRTALEAFEPRECVGRSGESGASR
jgi:hypothetical protein